jgi:hypothetical protein
MPDADPHAIELCKNQPGSGGVQCEAICDSPAALGAQGRPMCPVIDNGSAVTCDPQFFYGGHDVCCYGYATGLVTARVCSN